MKRLLNKHKELYDSTRLQKQSNCFTALYLDAYTANADKSIHMREALAVKAFYENCRIEVTSCELVVGYIASREPVGFHIGCGTYLNTDAAREFVQEQQMDENEVVEFERKLDIVRKNKFYNVWEEKFLDYYPDYYTEEELLAIDTGAASSTFLAGIWCWIMKPCSTVVWDIIVTS